MTKQRKPLIDKKGEVRPLTAKDKVTLKPLREDFPELAAHAEKRKVGRPCVAKPKRLQSFKLSQDVIEGIKSSGKGYNVRVEAVLRAALQDGLI